MGSINRAVFLVYCGELELCVEGGSREMAGTHKRDAFCFFDFNLNFGGAPRGSLDLASNLQSANENVVVYDAYGANSRYIDYAASKGLLVRILVPGVARTYIGGAGLARLIRALSQLPLLVKVGLQLRKWVKKDEVAVLWLNNEKSLLVASVAMLGLPIAIAFYHRGWAKPEGFSRLFRILIQWRCSLLLAHSNATVGNLKKEFPRKVIRYVPNGIRPKKKFLEGKKVSNNNSGFVVLLPAARPVREKGHHVAVMALAKLRDRGFRDITLIMPGEVATGVGVSYLAELKALICDLELEERVIFPGWVECLDDLIERSDVVVLPSHSEGFPRVVVEAMLARTPVVATPVGGIPEAIFNEKTGFIVGVEDATALALALERIIENPELVQNIVDSAHEFAICHFSVDRQISDVKEAFHDLARDRNGV